MHLCVTAIALFYGGVEVKGLQAAGEASGFRDLRDNVSCGGDFNWAGAQSAQEVTNEHGKVQGVPDAQGPPGLQEYSILNVDGTSVATPRVEDYGMRRDWRKGEWRGWTTSRRRAPPLWRSTT